LNKETDRNLSHLTLTVNFYLPVYIKNNAQPSSWCYCPFTIWHKKKKLVQKWERNLVCFLQSLTIIYTH